MKNSKLAECFLCEKPIFELSQRNYYPFRTGWILSSVILCEDCLKMYKNSENED